LNKIKGIFVFPLTIIKRRIILGVSIMDKKGGNVIFMPDIEYKSWVNRNKELLKEIISTGKVSTLWLQKGSNKAFLVRYFRECGYSISIDD